MNNLIIKRSFHASALKQKQLYGSILDTIGKTPIVKINNITTSKDVDIYVKCEYFNPSSSVKDRLAIAVIEDAESKGLIKPGDTIVEATSGNTGVALAMVCAQKGYKCVITMAESFSVERRKVMRMLGAKVITTPAPLKGSGMVNKAKELAKEHGWFQTRQFENPANAAYHSQTTAAEILSDFRSAGIDLNYLALGYGTGGTFTGAGKTLKAAKPDIKIALAEPASAALIGSGVAQERNDDGSPAATHPAFNPHPIQGWTPDFIPLLTYEGLEAGIHDHVVPVAGEECIVNAQRLAKEEGIFTGISGGASMTCALQVAEEHAKDGDTIVAILADTSERYLSTPLYASIDADMDEEEAAINKTTPIGN